MLNQLVIVKWLNKQKKWSGKRTGLKMSERATNVERKTWKDLQKTWRTIAQDHFTELHYITKPHSRLAVRSWRLKHFQSLTGSNSRCCPNHTAWLIHSPSKMPWNASDQWQRQRDPVGNKGYEVWQQRARWSPSSCLFLQVMGSHTEEWKSDPYIDFAREKFVVPSGDGLMNRKSASGFLQVEVQNRLITTVWCGEVPIMAKNEGRME